MEKTETTLPTTKRGRGRPPKNKEDKEDNKEYKPIAQGDFLTCPECGEENPKNITKCTACKAQLIPPENGEGKEVSREEVLFPQLNKRLKQAYEDDNEEKIENIIIYIDREITRKGASGDWIQDDEGYAVRKRSKPATSVAPATAPATAPAPEAPAPEAPAPEAPAPVAPATERTKRKRRTKAEMAAARAAAASPSPTTCNTPCGEDGEEEGGEEEGEEKEVCAPATTFPTPDEVYRKALIAAIDAFVAWAQSLLRH